MTFANIIIKSNILVSVVQYSYICYVKVRVMIGFTMDEDIKIPVTKTVDLCMTYNKLYDSIYPILARLEKSEWLLLMFLVMKANDSNLVDSNKLTRIEFAEYVEKATDKKLSYKDNTIQQCYTSLKKHGLLLATENQGVFYLNPEFIFRGGEKERIRRNKVIEGKYLKAM